MTIDDSAGEEALRLSAIERLRKRRLFYRHLLVYVLVNALLVVIWAFGSHGFFWPIFVIVGWGMAVGLNAWSVFRGGEDEERIQREMNRLREQS